MYTSQPPFFEIDHTNPLTKHITHCLPLGNCDRELVTGGRLAYWAGASKPVTQRGVSLKGNGSQACASIAIDLSQYDKVTLSFWMFLEPYTVTNTFPIEFGSPSWTNNGFIINPNSDAPFTGSVSFGTASGANLNLGYSTRQTPAVWNHYQITLDRSVTGTTNGNRIWVNGTSLTVNNYLANADVTGNFANSTLFINSQSNTSGFSSATLQNIVIRAGYLASTAEANEEYSNPWSLFKQPSRRLFIPASLPWFLVAPLYEKVINNPPQGVLLYNSLFMPTHEKVLDVLPQYVLPYNDLLAPTYTKTLDNLPQYVELAITITNNTFTALGDYLTQYLYQETLYHPSVERTFNVNTDQRAYSVSVENRGFAAQSESRIYSVLAEQRSFKI